MGNSRRPSDRVSGKPTAIDWAKIWHRKLAKFHNVSDKKRWIFGADHVIAFLIHHKNSGAPAWKRLKMAQALALYKTEFLGDQGERLDDICDQLVRVAARERGQQVEEIPASDLIGAIDPSEPAVIQQMRRVMRLNHLAWNTEKAYVSKLQEFFSKNDLWRDVESGSEANGWGLKRVGARDVEDHLTTLAVEHNVAESTQDQAFYAIRYLFTHVLKRELKCVDAIRSSKPKRIPTVMSHHEVAAVLERLEGVYRLMGQLMYGAGLRLSECLQLRVKDIDFDRKLLIVRDSKGKKDRATPLPEVAVAALKRQLAGRFSLHNQDLAEGTASVALPHALHRKYPNAHIEFRWQFVFASSQHSRHPRSGRLHRHHLHADTFPDNLKVAVSQTGMTKAITSHVFRHSFATHLLMAGEDIRTVQELLGHKDVSTTMIYLHCLNDRKHEVVSPLDRLHREHVGKSRAGDASAIDTSTIDTSTIDASAFPSSRDLGEAERKQHTVGPRRVERQPKRVACPTLSLPTDKEAPRGAWRNDEQKIGRLKAITERWRRFKSRCEGSRRTRVERDDCSGSNVKCQTSRLRKAESFLGIANRSDDHDKESGDRLLRRIPMRLEIYLTRLRFRPISNRL